MTPPPRTPPDPAPAASPPALRVSRASRAPPRVARVLAHALLVSVVALAPARALAPAVGGPGDAAPWLPPFGTPLLVSGPYRPPPTPYTAGHRGVDVPAGPGAIVAAPADGTVEFVGAVVDRGTLTVRVDADTVYSWEPIESALSVGDRVVAGAPLGTAASGGHCAAECVHLGVREQGEYVSPLRYLLGRPVLLPWE